MSNELPPVDQLLQTHTLASKIISYHKTPSPILDASELSLLRAFCANPSTVNRKALLTEHDMLDAPGDRPGASAATQKGSLVGMLIARWGTEEPALVEGEWEKLKDWFKMGGGA